MPLAIFEYFWLILPVFMSINLFAWRRRMAPMLADGSITRAEVDGFTWAAGLALCAPWPLLFLVQKVSGWDSPFCVYASPLSSPGVMATVLVQALWLAAICGWVWLGGGAELLSKVSPALARRSPGRRLSPGQIRLGAVAVVLLAAISTTMSFATSRGMPPVCHLPTAAH